MNGSQETQPKPEAGLPLGAARCSASVADFTGFHFHKCKSPAKWLVNGKPRCGRHAIGYWKTIRVPISPNGALCDPAHWDAGKPEIL